MGNCILNVVDGIICALAESRSSQFVVNTVLETACVMLVNRENEHSSERTCIWSICMEDAGLPDPAACCVCIVPAFCGASFA